MLLAYKHFCFFYSGGYYILLEQFFIHQKKFLLHTASGIFLLFWQHFVISGQFIFFNYLHLFKKYVLLSNRNIQSGRKSFGSMIYPATFYPKGANRPER